MQEFNWPAFAGNLAVGTVVGVGIAPPEHVVVRKLEYLREGAQDKHLRDIRCMLAATTMDRAFIEVEVARLGLAAEWARCANPAPRP